MHGPPWLPRGVLATPAQRRPVQRGHDLDPQLAWGHAVHLMLPSALTAGDCALGDHTCPLSLECVPHTLPRWLSWCLLAEGLSYTPPCVLPRSPRYARGHCHAHACVLTGSRGHSGHRRTHTLPHAHGCIVGIQSTRTGTRTHSRARGHSCAQGALPDIPPATFPPCARLLAAPRAL